MTKITEPVERSLSWFPCLAEWTTHPLCRRLRKADKANPDRWTHMVSLAHRCKAKGRLQMADGTVLTVEDLAYDHDREDEEWAEFIALCQQLNLVAVEDGCVVILNWSNWNRDAAHERETEKQKKRAERAAAKVADLEAKNAALQAQFDAQVAEFRAYLSRPIPDAVPSLSPECPDSVPALSPSCPDAVPSLSPDVPHLDLDETRHRLDESKSNSACAGETLAQTPREAAQSQQRVAETEFDVRVRTCYQALTGRALAGRDEEATLSAMLDPAWRPHGPAARADAIEAAAQLQGDDPPDRGTWKRVLSDALQILVSARASPEPEESS